MPVRKAIGIDEDQPVGAADAYGAILNARLAKTKILVPDMLDRMDKPGRPSLEQRAVAFRRAIIGDDDLEILPGLAYERGEVALDNIRIAIARHNDRSGGGRPHGRTARAPDIAQWRGEVGVARHESL